MSSAFSITQAVNPPRAAFLDFPLGHTTGKPNAPSLQQQIMGDALKLFETLEQPGQIAALEHCWDHNDDWKNGVMRPRATSNEHKDDRSERSNQPQYQDPDDEAHLETPCPTCIWLEYD